MCNKYHTKENSIIFSLALKIENWKNMLIKCHVNFPIDGNSNGKYILKCLHLKILKNLLKFSLFLFSNRNS